MRTEALTDPSGVRVVPEHPTGTGVLVLAGSSGRVDDGRAEVFARVGCLAESIRWFGGPGQQPGPWEVPLETFLGRIGVLAADCDRVVLVGASFGAEAALLSASLSSAVDAVVGFAPSDVVWAGVTPDGRQTSHWTLGGHPLPFVPFVEDWQPTSDPPAYREYYARSRLRAGALVGDAVIAVERIPEVLLVAGGDDRVWPSVEHADSIRARRAASGRPTEVVVDPDAGHRTLLPGENVVSGGQRMARGGTKATDRRLGSAAWVAVERLLRRTA